MGRLISELFCWRDADVSMWPEAYEPCTEPEREEKKLAIRPDQRHDGRCSHTVQPYEQSDLLRVDHFPRGWFVNLGLGRSVQAHPPDPASRPIFLPPVLLLVVLTSRKDTGLIIVPRLYLTVNTQRSGRLAGGPWNFVTYLEYNQMCPELLIRLPLLHLKVRYIPHFNPGEPRPPHHARKDLSWCLD